MLGFKKKKPPNQLDLQTHECLLGLFNEIQSRIDINSAFPYHAEGGYWKFFTDTVEMERKNGLIEAMRLNLDREQTLYIYACPNNPGKEFNVLSLGPTTHETSSSIDKGVRSEETVYTSKMETMYEGLSEIDAAIILQNILLDKKKYYKEYALEDHLEMLKITAILGVLLTAVGGGLAYCTPAKADEAIPEPEKTEILIMQADRNEPGQF